MRFHTICLVVLSRASSGTAAPERDRYDEGAVNVTGRAQSVEPERTTIVRVTVHLR